MYELFYRLQAEPFRLSPDHRFCYDHKGYAKARAYLAYAYLRAEGFVMITGGPGTGKTTLIGELIDTLADENVVVANLVCTQLRADDLLTMVAYHFGVDSDVVEKGQLLERLRVLLLQRNREGRRALLIVDEAQDLSTSALEELRLLTNIQVDGNPLVQIFLLGQSELRDMIINPNLEQVHQRIVAASHLEPLEEIETEQYIIHRLQRVGWQGDPAISKAVYPLIYKFSGGIPRRINLICSRLFLHAAVEQQHRIGVEDMRQVVGELHAEFLALDKSITDYDFDVEDVFEDDIVANAVDPKSLDNEPSAVQPAMNRPSSQAAVDDQTQSTDTPQLCAIDSIEPETSPSEPLSVSAYKAPAAGFMKAQAKPLAESEWPSFDERTLLISFLFDSTKVPAHSLSDLYRIIDILAGHRDSIAVIEGYSDDIGSPEHNLALSQERANAVAQYLIDRSILADRLEVIGCGASAGTTSNRGHGSLGGRFVQITIRRADQQSSKRVPGGSEKAIG